MAKTITLTVSDSLYIRIQQNKNRLEQVVDRGERTLRIHRVPVSSALVDWVKESWTCDDPEYLWLHQFDEILVNSMNDWLPAHGYGFLGNVDYDELETEWDREHKRWVLVLSVHLHRMLLGIQCGRNMTLDRLLIEMVTEELDGRSDDLNEGNAVQECAPWEYVPRVNVFEEEEDPGMPEGPENEDQAG